MKPETAHTRQIVARFGALIDAAQELMHDENRALKEGGASQISKDLLTRKEGLIRQMEELLQLCRGRHNEASSEERSELGRLQGRLMTLLVIDRENERLLLQSTIPRRPPALGRPMRMARSYLRTQRMQSPGEPSIV